MNCDYSSGQSVEVSGKSEGLNVYGYLPATAFGNIVVCIVIFTISCLALLGILFLLHCSICSVHRTLDTLEEQSTKNATIYCTSAVHCIFGLSMAWNTLFRL